MGRLAHVKNPELILQIMCVLKDKGYNLNWVGGGELEEEIKEAIIRLGLSNNINMLGHQKNVRTYLENASVFLLPSISEGLSIATIEAQAMGLPCVVSDSVPSEVNCGLCKFMSLNDPPQEWAHQIDVLATGKEKLTIDIERLNRFEVSKTLRQLQEIYE